MSFSLNRFILKKLELKEKEVKVFILLFLHSFFIGWFIAFYFASSNSEFIVHYGSKQLPFAYILSGLAGYLVSSLYTVLQKRTGTKVLFSGTLIFMFFIAILSRFTVNFINPKILSAFVFIWAWPFISLSGIELGGLSLRFLNLIQVKRLYGLFNMGGVLSAILSYFALALLKPLLGHIYNFLLIGAAGLIVSIFILFRLYKYHANDAEESHIQNKKQKNNIKDTFKDKYLVWIFASATLSMVMIYLTDFGFLSSVKMNIDPKNVAQYLAIAYGGLKVGELIISYYSRRLLTNYGVKLGLTILPITSAFLVLVTAIWGISFGIGMMFLVLMTSLKALERILRRGLDDPAFNILYQPLADDQKLAIQSRVGVVMQVSIGIAGAILLLINYILHRNGEFQLQYFPFLFLPVLVLWVFSAIKLYSAYKNKIRQILAAISKDKRRGTDQYQYGSEILGKRLNDDNFFAVTFCSTVLGETNPKIIEPYASNLLTPGHSPNFIKIISKSIDPSWRRRLSKNTQDVLKNELAEDIMKAVQHAHFNLDYTNINDNITEEQAQQLLSTNKTKDKITLIKYIHKHLYQPSEEVLLKLLDDDEKIVKISVINISSTLKTEKVVEKIASFLQYPEYRHIAANTLLDLGGNRVLHVLEKYFKENPDIDVLLKIVEIYAKISTDAAKNLLLKHLNYPNRELQISIVFALFYCKFEANEDQKPFIEQKLNEVIDSILWIYAALIDVEGQPNTLKLFLALDYEKEFYFELLFLLLSFLYEPRIITLIQKNIVGKDTIFALEIMDNFFDSDIKKLISPIFDDITSQQKLKRLNNLFPQQRLNITERLKDIILQDYERLDPWTISKAIELLGKLHKKNVYEKKQNREFLTYSDITIWKKERVLITLEKIRKSEIPDEVFVALYHPNEVIYTAAAKIIFDDNPVKCFDYLANMSPKKQKLMNLLSNNKLLIDDKIKFIKKVPLFFNIPENILTSIVKISEVFNLEKDDVLNFFENQEEFLFMVVSGMLRFNISDTEHKFYAKNDIIIRGINIDDFASSVVVHSKSVVIAFKRVEFFNTIVSNKEIARLILADTENMEWVIE